jgi:outer membrane protein
VNHFKIIKHPMFIITAFLTLLVGGVSVSSAQTRLTLDDCLNIALKNSKQLGVLEEKINAAQAKKKEAFGSYLPQLNAALSYTRLVEPPVIPLPPTYGGFSIPLFTEDSYVGTLSLQQPLYLGGRVRESNIQADLNYNMTALNYKKFKDDLIFETKESFYNVILADQLVRINQEAYDVTEAHLNTSQALYKQGKIPNYDVSRVKVQLANNRTSLLKARNNLRISQESLLTLIGFKKEMPDSEIEIFGQLSFMEKQVKDFDTGLTQALIKRIEIAKMDLEEKLNASQIDVYRAGWRPSLVAGGSYNYQAAKWSGRSDDWYKYWSANLTLSIPIFDGFITSSRVKQGLAQKEQLRLDKEQLIDNIKLEIRQAHYNLEQASENIKGQQENIDTAKDNLRIAQERYKLGLMSDIEVRDAELALAQAETNYYQALFDYITSREKWEKVIGDTLE